MIIVSGPMALSSMNIRCWRHMGQGYAHSPNWKTEAPPMVAHIPST